MQAFVALVLCSSLARPFASDDICKRGILLTLFDSSTIPFIGKSFADFN